MVVISGCEMEIKEQEPYRFRMLFTISSDDDGMVLIQIQTVILLISCLKIDGLPYGH